MKRNKPVTVALVGAGARGELNLATLARKHPDKIKFVAVVDLDDERRERFAKSFNIPRANVMSDWRELAVRPQLADAVLNALPCRLHYESTLAVLRAGYDVFLEKPMALTPGESVHLTRVAEAGDRLLVVSLQSRYNKIYTRIRKIMDQERKLGRLLAVDCAENIGYWHFLMSYVRGIHHRADMSHSFVMAKGVHDLDLVAWFAGAPARRVASFGALSFFTPENAPAGAPERCLDGCPAFDTCLFNAYRQFVRPGKPDIPPSLLTGMSLGAVRDVLFNPRFRTLASVIVRDIREENVLRNLRETMNGVCAFRCDNNVVDHQTVSIEFENETTASFQLNGFSLIWERTLNLHGTEGELRSADFSGRLETRTYNPGRVKRERIRYHGIVHGGGDEMILVRFAEGVAERKRAEVLVSAQQTLESHLLCFAAEEARLGGRVVEMADFRRRAEEDARRLEEGK